MSENDESIENLESRERMAEDEILSHKEVANRTILNHEEEMPLQK